MAKKYSKRVIETPLADVAPEDREEHITLVREQIVKLAQSAQISLDGVRASVHEMGPLFDYLKEEQRKGYIGREFSPHQMPPLWLEGALVKEFTRQEIPGTKRSHLDKTIIPPLVKQMVQNLQNVTLTDPGTKAEDTARKQAEWEQEERTMAETRRRTEHVKAALAAVSGDGLYAEEDLPEAVRDYLESTGVRIDLAFVVQVMKELGFFDPNMSRAR